MATYKGVEINTTPTQEIADQAQKGLDWREKFGRGGTRVGAIRARQLVRREELSIDTVQRMKSFLARHEVNLETDANSDPDDPGYPGAGLISFYLWGGYPAKAWSERIMERVNKIDEEGRSYHTSFQVGDFVRFRARKGTYTGKIVSIRTEGETEFGGESLTATPDDPVARIRIYAPREDGTYMETDRVLGMNLSRLSKIDEPEIRQPDLNDSTMKAVRRKHEEHQEKYKDDPKRSVPLSAFIEVTKRGIGAYKTQPSSVRPGVVSAEQWALGRLNSFIRALVNLKFKNKPHDTDLLPKEHPLSTKERSMEAQDNWPELRYGHEPVGEEEEPEHTMDPKSHVVMQDDGMFGVVNINGDVVATFQDKEMAEKYAMENHDDLMKEDDDEMSESAGHEDMEERPGHEEMEERPGMKEEKSYHDEDDRMIETGALSRVFDFDRSAIDEQNRTVSVIFSTETPVDRNFGVEILDHDRGSVRMDRLEKRAPVLLNHSMSDQLGVVERATIDPDRKGRAVLRFGRGRLSTEVFNDVVDGIRSQVSVGYRIHQMEKVDDKKLTYRAVDWQPFEISIVPTGADSMAIVGRSENKNFKTQIVERNSKMETQIIQESAPKVNENAIREQVQKAEFKRIQEIESYGQEHSEVELARTFIQDGKSVADFQTAILDKIKNRKPEEVHAIGLTKKETRSFSWMKLIRAMANPHDRKLQEDASFEFEASRAQADKNGIDPQGAWVPADVIYGQNYQDQQRDLTVGTNTAGGFTVQTDVLADSFIDVLRANMVFDKVGVTELNGLNGKVSIPGSDAGSQAYWVAENGAVTESDQTFISRSLNGLQVGAMTDISANLMKQSSIDVEAFVRNDIAMTLASQIELQGLTGNGTSNRPIGVYNTTGVGGVTINGANAPDWGDVVDIWTGLASNNALRGNLNWVGASTITANMMKTFRNGTGSDRPILDDTVGMNGEHRLMTYPYYITENNVEAGKSLLTFGDWSSLVMGSWGNGLDLKIDPFTNSSTGATRIVGLYLVDFAVRTPKSFSASVNP